MDPRSSKRGVKKHPPILFALAAVTLLTLVFAAAEVRGAASPPRRDEPDLPAAASPPAAADASRSAVQKALGRWVRADGGYVLHIKGVAGDGAMEAAYFNPRSIHVARARADFDGAAVRLFVELRDVNYPGSTYRLRHDPKTDRLVGEYFQAVQRETYAIEFVRAAP